MKDQTSFFRFLFRTAFCFMTCDGHIDDREIDEIKRLADSTNYFRGVDVEDELHTLIKTVKKQGRRVFRNYMDDLAGQEYDVVQELMLLEVALRVIYIDLRIDANEVKFLRILRSKLQVPNEIILQRFGKVDLLFGGKKTPGMSAVLGHDDEDFIGAGFSDEDFKSLDVDWERLGRSS